MPVSDYARLSFVREPFSRKRILGRSSIVSAPNGGLRPAILRPRMT